MHLCLNGLAQPHFKARTIRSAQRQFGPVLQHEREVAVRERAKLADARGVDRRGAMDAYEPLRVEALEQLGDARSIEMTFGSGVQVEVHPRGLNPVHIVDIEEGDAAVGLERDAFQVA